MPEWDGTERRKNSMNGKEIISEIKSRLDVLETMWQERWRNHDLQADDRQKSVCGKLNEIKEDIADIKTNAIALDKAATVLMGNMDTRLANLPCKERASIYTSVKTQIKYLWGVLLTLLAGIVGTIWWKK